MPPKRAAPSRTYRSAKRRYGTKSKFVRRPVRRTNMARLIRSVALKTAETKHAHRSVENQQLYHNIPSLYAACLYTSVGMSDEVMDSAVSYDTRVGDEIYAKGIDFRFWFSNKADRPNCQYRVVIFKFRSSVIPSSDTIFQNYAVAATVANNKMIAYLDTANVTILKQFRIQSNGGDYSLESGSANKEKSFERKIYLDLKMAKVKYTSAVATTPKDYNIGVCIVAYDSYGTLETDNIASVAWSYKLYFKDP